MQSKVQVWIYQKQGAKRPVKLLLLKMRKDRGGYWQPVTGKVEKKEAFDVAALREATEETSIPFLEKPLDSGYSFDFEGRRGRAHEKVYSLRVPDDFLPDDVKLDPHEHVAFQWMDQKSARQILSFESNQAALDQVAKQLRWE